MIFPMWSQETEDEYNNRVTSLEKQAPDYDYIVLFHDRTLKKGLVGVEMFQTKNTNAFMCQAVEPDKVCRTIIRGMQSLVNMGGPMPVYGRVFFMQYSKEPLGPQSVEETLEMQENIKLLIKNINPKEYETETVQPPKITVDRAALMMEREAKEAEEEQKRKEQEKADFEAKKKAEEAKQEKREKASKGLTAWFS